jgi:nicotinamide mononucleotide (NMN) deamidase PncC
MDGSVRALVAALHAAPFRYVLSLAGGGVGAAEQLLTVPGGSRTILEVSVPYSEEALAGFLGRRPESFCSADTARALAARALERARWLAASSAVAGAGCTASLRSDRPKRGDHRFYVAVQTARRVLTRSATFVKDARDREGEEAVVSAVVLNLLAEAFGLEERVPSLLLPGEELTGDSAAAGPLAAFLAGEGEVLCIEPDGKMNPAAPPPPLLLSGSFNPLHEGHTTLANVAASLFGAPVAFELSVQNADKPPLADEEVRARMAHFAWRAPVWLARAPTFTAKARLFPGTTFVVGADTAVRILDPRYYAGSESNRDAELAGFRSRGCRFLVAGRVDATGRFLGAEDLHIPVHLTDLFRGIPASHFRRDVSSTQIRSAAGA